MALGRFGLAQLDNAMFVFMKNWFGERVASFGMALTLDRRIYRHIDDLVLSTDTGAAQLDHVIVSRFGIFVIETKNMNGWIFGSEREPLWTQVNFGRKDRFQNPLCQNYRHTRAIAEQLGIDHDAVHSVVFFSGDCCFKTEMPANVLTDDVSGYIQSQSSIWFSQNEVDVIEEQLRDIKAHALCGANHMRAFRERFTRGDLSRVR